MRVPLCDSFSVKKEFVVILCLLLLCFMMLSWQVNINEQKPCLGLINNHPDDDEVSSS